MNSILTTLEGVTMIPVLKGGREQSNDLTQIPRAVGGGALAARDLGLSNRLVLSLNNCAADMRSQPHGFTHA